MFHMAPESSYSVVFHLVSGGTKQATVSVLLAGYSGRGWPHAIRVLGYGVRSERIVDYSQTALEKTSYVIHLVGGVLERKVI